MLASYRRFLAIPGAPRLLLSAVATRMPNGMLALALVLLLRGHSGTFALAGLAVGAFALCSAAVAPVQGIAVDRLGAPRVLAVCGIGQSAALVGLVLAVHAGAPSAVAVALVGLAGALVPPSMACARALWPVITPDTATRDAAYALDAITLEITWVLGPLLVVAAVALASPSAALLACVVITLAGTAVLASSPHARAWHPVRGRRPRAGAVASARLRRLLASTLLMGFWWGCLQVGLPALALHAGAHQAAGVLLGLVSLGGVLGGVAHGARRWRLELAPRYAVLLLALAVTLVPLIMVRSLAAAYPLSLLAGLAMTPAISCQNTLAGLAAPAGAVTEAFTWTVAAMWGGVALGSALGGSLVDAAGIGAPFSAAAGAVLLAAVIAAAPAPGSPGRLRRAAAAAADAQA